MKSYIKRGEIYFADLEPVIGSEQGGTRPVLILSNNTGNHYSSTVIAAAITSQYKSKQPTHIDLTGFAGLPYDSTVLLEQVRTLDKQRLERCYGRLDDSTMAEIDLALAVSMGLASTENQTSSDIKATSCE